MMRATNDTEHFHGIAIADSNNFLNTETDILDECTIHVLEIFTNCVMINLIGLFGIIGNSINILVLCKHGFRETTNLILVSLSISDLLFSIILPVTRLKCVVSHFDAGMANTLNAYVTVYLFMPKYLCLATGLCYVTIIAVERFVAVFFPFKVSKVFTKPTMKTIVAVVPTMSLIVLIPTFLALKFTWTYNSGLNETVAVIEYTKFYLENKDFLDFYAWVGLNNFFCILSILITSMCCVAIGFKLSHAAVKREAMTSRSSGYDVRVVRMLVTICVVFLVVTIPNLVLYSYFVPNFIFTSPLHELVDNVCAILYAVNSSANFLVYVTMSKKFARTYKSLLVCKKLTNKKY